MIPLSPTPCKPSSLPETSIWKYVWPLIHEQWKGVIIGVFLLILSIGASLLIPWPMQIIVDCILSQARPLPNWLSYFQNNQTTALAVICASLFVIHVARGSFNTWSTTYLVRAGLRMTRELRCKLYEHLQKLGLVFHDNRAVGDSIYRVTWDTYSIQSIFNSGLVPLLSSSITLLGMLVVMVQFDFVLTCLAMGVAPALAWTIRIYNRRISAESIEYHSLESKVSSLIQETLAAIRTVQSFAREEDEVRRFGFGTSQSVEANVRLTYAQMMSSFIIGLITASGTVAMIWVGGNRVITGRLSVGELLVFISYVGMLYGPMSTISGLAATLQKSLIPFRRIVEILITQPIISDPPHAEPLVKCRGVIRFDNVTFGYDQNTPILKNIYLEAHPGQLVALVGASGVGKTTLLSLLLRFYDPQEGSLLIDGRDMREFQYRSLRRQISIVPQEPVLFSTSIAENIAYGNPEATREEIIEAATQAEAHEFIVELPNGYDSSIGERGVLLSGGQRQRLALARAFLKDSPILILDEPTAALDAETEASILRALEKLRKGRTLLVVAHRLSTVRQADELLVIQDGRIVERGKHDELIKINGHYAHLYNLQFGNNHSEKKKSSEVSSE